MVAFDIDHAFYEKSGLIRDWDVGIVLGSRQFGM